MVEALFANGAFESIKGFSITYFQKVLKKADISWLLIPSMGLTLKPLDPTIPIIQTNSIFH